MRASTQKCAPLFLATNRVIKCEVLSLKNRAAYTCDKPPCEHTYIVHKYRKYNYRFQINILTINIYSLSLSLTEHAATIERQKARRDKLANALRDNKKRLLSLEQEINILTEPIEVGQSERLDREISQLTEACRRLINGKPKTIDYYCTIESIMTDISSCRSAAESCST